MSSPIAFTFFTFQLLDTANPYYGLMQQLGEWKPNLKSTSNLVAFFKNSSGRIDGVYEVNFYYNIAYVKRVDYGLLPTKQHVDYIDEMVTSQLMSKFASPEKINLIDFKMIVYTRFLDNEGFAILSRDEKYDVEGSPFNSLINSYIKYYEFPVYCKQTQRWLKPLPQPLKRKVRLTPSKDPVYGSKDCDESTFFSRSSKYNF